MKNKLEATIENDACKEAKKHGWWGIKLIPKLVRGIPDRMFVGHGKVVFIEFKRTSRDKPRKAQEAIHRRFARHGINVHVAWEVNQVMDILNEAKTRT